MNVREHGWSPWWSKNIFLENIFIILLNSSLFEKEWVESDDFSVFRGGDLGPPETWSPTSEVISPALDLTNEDTVRPSLVETRAGRLLNRQ